MLGFEASHVDIMSLEPAEILDPVSKVFALLKVASGVLVPLGPVPLQGKVDQGPAKNGGRKRMFCLQRSRGRRQDLVEVAIEFVCTGEHQVRGLVQRRPGHQKTQGMVHARMAQRMGDGPLLSLKILKVGQALEIGAQVLRVERAFEAGPAKRLRLICSSEGLENLKPSLLPFDRDPAGSVLIDGIDGSPGFLRAASSQEPLRDLHSNTRNASGLLTLLCNEGVHIALRIRNRLQRHSNNAAAMALGQVIGVQGTTRYPSR